MLISIIYISGFGNKLWEKRGVRGGKRLKIDIRIDALGWVAILTIF